MAKPGPKTKLTPELKLVACRAFRRGFGVVTTAEVCGVTKQTFLNWRQADPAFSSDLERSRGAGKSWVMSKLIAQIKSGSVKAATWWLEHCCDEFKPQKQDDADDRVAEAYRDAAQMVIDSRPTPP